ncbi:primosomal protein N' [Helicobacter sp. 10-6591]|uniref:primosomal protein N' n=1 Tax=Helicobacter sp. 10-6591 TaxID=2004998 RepID=UPI000DCB3031|nr:primosomal protein N' [Helicobacter sp. 10-6591]RAX56181.1 primosomal protein N' [Helicobacter sp. 10-6591]
MNPYFVLVAPLGISSPPLTYKMEYDCLIYDIVEIAIKNKSLLGVVIKKLDSMTIAPALIEVCKYATASDLAFLSHQKFLAEFIVSYYCASFSQSFAQFIAYKRDSQNSLESLDLQNLHLPQLSVKQQEALEFIQNTQNTLLFGDTGSGKTEIYIHLIAQALLKRKQALLLMPEIALTPQIEQRLQRIFGTLVGIWHSKITSKKKQEFLDRLYKGEIRVIAGARSSLFLPLYALGVIVVDEEHDDAYKSQNIPYYNARDLALYLGKHTDIKVVLGSATPSLLSYSNAAKNHTLFRLKGSYFNADKKIIFNPEEPLSDSMLSYLESTYKNSKQSIVFLPTRANFKSLFCKECAHKVQCIFCSVNLSVHSKKNALVCHYCGFTQQLIDSCPQCGSKNLAVARIGTQEFAKELATALPQAEIGIFDKDHISTHNKLQSILKKFNEHKIDILIGTQMLSKGHDYHNIELCVIVGIDYILNAIDYRANERAMSLLVQIAGRAGRKSEGIVFIQTSNTGFFSQFGLDYEMFLQNELCNRPRIYPPFTRLANLSFTHKDKEVSYAQMQAALKLIEDFVFRNSKESYLEIVGAKLSDIARLKGKYRHNILLRAQKNTIMRQAINYVRKNLDFDFIIDIDPLSTL